MTGHGGRLVFVGSTSLQTGKVYWKTRLSLDFYLRIAQEIQYNNKDISKMIMGELCLNLTVSKKRLIGTAALLLFCIGLVIVNMDLFIYYGWLDEPKLNFVLAMLLIGCYAQSVRIEMPNWLNGIWMIAAFLILPYVMVYIIEYFGGQDAAELPKHLFWLNYFWCQIVYLLLFAFTNHYRFSIIAGSVFCYLVGGINYHLLLFRGSPLQLTDVMSIGTAADVAANYVITMNSALLLTGSVTFFAVCLACVADFRVKRRHWYDFVGTLALLCYLFVSVGCFYDDKTWEENSLVINFWNPLQGYEDNGTALSLAMAGKYLRPEKPASYSAGNAEDIMLAAVEANAAETMALSEAEADNHEEVDALPVLAEKPEDTAPAVTKPNIIAIMNESYADLRIHGDFKTSVPVMSYYDSLQENTIRGNLAVSVLGGGTCNSEFEFLTGLTTAFLPNGVMAYQQYIGNETPSMASILKDQGYRAIAFHPGKPDSWRRNSVYPYFGFEEFLTEEDMENPKYMRGAYVTDSSNYKEVIRLFEEKEDDEKLFLFNVTIQNHGGYQLDTVGIPKWVSLMGKYGNFNETEQYLSLMHASDTALRELISYFKKVDEPTLIVFFGDHQPSVEGDFIAALKGKPLNELNLEEVQSRYIAPFFIWANYDIEEAYYENISANYLSTLTMKTAGVELSVYNQYLDQLYDELPMINALGYADHNGTYYYHTDETELTEAIEGYKVVQYNYLFGGMNRLNDFYTVKQEVTP